MHLCNHRRVYSFQYFYPEKPKTMNTKSNSDIDASANNETSRGDCTNPVRSKPSTRYLGASVRRLGNWLAARIQAHEDRIIELRVYRQDRLDGGVTDRRRDG